MACTITVDNKIEDVNGVLMWNGHSLISYYQNELIRLHELEIDDRDGINVSLAFSPIEAFEIAKEIERYESKKGFKKVKYTPLFYSNGYDGEHDMSSIRDIEHYIVSLIREVNNTCRMFCDDIGYDCLVFDDKRELFVNADVGFLSLRKMLYYISTEYEEEDRQPLSPMFGDRLEQIKGIVDSYEVERKKKYKDTDAITLLESIIKRHMSYHADTISDYS